MTATYDHRRPWRVEWTRFGESMGYDSRSRILDADGRLVAQLGNGASDQRALAEATAQLIVSKVNAAEREAGLREALRPFAAAAAEYVERADDDPIDDNGHLMAGDLRRAAEALSAPESRHSPDAASAATGKP